MAYTKKIEKSLSNLLFRDKNSKLQEAMAYSLLGGGKRVRGQLYLYHLRAFKAPLEEDYSFSAAIEMIHAYSLIHDDLPAMDNDTLRRGKPTNHIAYGEALAILAGDGLLNLAYEICFDLALKDPDFLLLAQKLARAAGDQGMIYGQMLDLSYQGRTMEEELIKEMLLNKTGKLIALPIEAAALRAKRGQEEVNRWKKLGMKLGLAFQIKDDLLDVDSTAAILGKTPGKDQIDKKNSYVQFHGYDKAQADYKKLQVEILEELALLSSEEKLLGFYHTLLERKY
ncbi:MAG TPA: polyprenyl synthetase family protein [Clostridia bacterium]|nr:polyprenyl synthetase family protein [Clostridia bacterium]